MTGQSDAAWDPNPGLWGSVVVPDVQLISWVPFAVEAALRLHRREHFDAVITTSPVESVHLAGLALRARGVPWVADLRDGWRYEAPRGDLPLALQRRIDDGLERAVLTRADALVMVTEPLSIDLRRRYGVAVETITNGYDSDDEALAAGVTAAVNPAKFTIAYTGRLGERQTLAPVLEAFARIARDEPGLADRAELLLAGQETAGQRELYGRPEFAPYIRRLGFVPRPQSLAIQRAADALVLVTSGARVGEATGKLFEYLAAGRPILALADGSAAGEIVRAAGAGIVIPTHDGDAAEAALRQILARELPAPPQAGRAQFAYPALAERYEQLIERTISACARRAQS